MPRSLISSAILLRQGNVREPVKLVTYLWFWTEEREREDDIIVDFGSVFGNLSRDEEKFPIEVGSGAGVGWTT